MLPQAKEQLQMWWRLTQKPKRQRKYVLILVDKTAI